jgi:predicted  nucleic acid-binding Zn-ribbon protein
MWQEFTGALKKIILLDERTEKNTKDIADVQEELRNLTKAVERLASEIKRIDEREA